MLSFLFLTASPMRPAELCRRAVADQIKSAVPFFAITQSLSGLFRQLLSESAAQLTVWRRRLSRALGKEARILADVLPSLEHVFERGWMQEQPAVPVLSPHESNERFQSLVQKVLRAFARAGKPLVVVFGASFRLSSHAPPRYQARKRLDP